MLTSQMAKACALTILNFRFDLTNAIEVFGQRETENQSDLQAQIKRMEFRLSDLLARFEYIYLYILCVRRTNNVVFVLANTCGYKTNLFYHSKRYFVAMHLCLLVPVTMTMWRADTETKYSCSVNFVAFLRPFYLPFIVR